VVFRWLCLTPPALEAPVCHWETGAFHGHGKECIASPVLWCWRRLAEFAKSPHRVARHNTPRTVVDCWRVLPHLQTANASVTFRLEPAARPHWVQGSEGCFFRNQVISIFAMPKPFHGHIEIIQRNAIQSWTRLDPASKLSYSAMNRHCRCVQRIRAQA